MPTLADVKRIALALPGVSEGGAHNRFGLGVTVKGKVKGFVWTWKERVDPRKPRVENLRVIAVRVANLGARDLMIAHAPKKFFTEPHYNGFPAVLVRLDAVTVAELRMLLKDAWRCHAEPATRKRATKA